MPHQCTACLPMLPLCGDVSEKRTREFLIRGPGHRSYSHAIACECHMSGLRQVRASYCLGLYETGLSTPENFITTGNHFLASHNNIREDDLACVACLCSKEICLERKKCKEKNLREEVGTRHEMFFFLLSNLPLLLIIFEFLNLCFLSSFT